MKNKYKIRVFCTLQFTATHRCPEEVCPKTAMYLTTSHRHVFHVRCEALVKHDNRDIEFITLKERVQKYISEGWHLQNLGIMSCEKMAVTLLDIFPELVKVEVSEDGENGAVVEKEIDHV